MKTPTILTLLTCLFILPLGVYASEEDEMAEMQRQLNAEVMNESFDAGDVAKADAYIKEAMAKDLKPVAKAPNYWRPGYSCRDIRRYGYIGYRNCRYHYRYYGRYW